MASPATELELTAYLAAVTKQAVETAVTTYKLLLSFDVLKVLHLMLAADSLHVRAATHFQSRGSYSSACIIRAVHCCEQTRRQDAQASANGGDSDQPSDANSITAQAIAVLLCGVIQQQLTATSSAVSEAADANQRVLVHAVNGYLNFELLSRDTLQQVETSNGKRKRGQQHRTSNNDAPAATNADGSSHAQHTIQPIGVIHTPFSEKYGTPRQPCATLQGKVVMDARIPDFAFEQLTSYSHLQLIFQFDHHVNTADLQHHNYKVTPPKAGGQRVGLYATRSPHRPNALGLSMCRLIDVTYDKTTKQTTLHITGVDMVDQTLLIDLKPYHPADAVAVTDLRVPQWLSNAQVANVMPVLWTYEARRQLHTHCNRMQLYNDQPDAASAAIDDVLALDPRTMHSIEAHDRTAAIYGVYFDGLHVIYRVGQMSSGPEVTQVFRVEVPPDSDLQQIGDSDSGDYAYKLRTAAWYERLKQHLPPQIVLE